MVKVIILLLEMRKIGREGELVSSHKLSNIFPVENCDKFKISK